jgi:sterol desaturase/sphingolipid hydroxylase (fatty acid hydroxylase superfamily)
MTYDWQAALTFLATLVGLTLVGRRLAFLVPALQRMRDLNREADARKMSRKRFRDWVRVNQRAGLAANVVFYLGVLPFSVSLAPRPLWRHVVDIAVVLLVFDLFYYATHRFLFHGRPLRKIHALHHQARTPTHVDAFYVHPVETVIGLALFLFSIPLVAAVAGAPLSAYSMAVATLVFTQVNTLNHTFVHLPYFPWRTLDTLTSLHAAHHVDMNRGNFATLTMLYDWLFGTLERPVHRESP